MNSMQMSPEMMEQQEKIKKYFKDAIDMSCDSCGSVYFKETRKMKRIPKDVLKEERDIVFPFPVLICEKCGHANTDLNTFG